MNRHHGDVWVIDAGQACLLRPAPEGWQQELRVPFDEFVGSATALSSFTLGDTRVYYNIRVVQHPARFPTESRWVGIGKDPLRLLEAPSSGLEQHELQALRSMGKKPCIMACPEPGRFESGVPMVLCSEQEHQHLRTWVENSSGRQPPYLAGLVLLSRLWQKPGQIYNRLRLVALVCTAMGAIVALEMEGWSGNSQHARLAQQVQDAMRKAPPPIHTIAWNQWETQLGKFGRDKRANLTSIHIQWDSTGQVETRVTLNKERKRVPKGCELTGKRNASCLTSGVLE